MDRLFVLRLALSDFRRFRPVDLICGHELFCQKRLNAMQIVTRIGPLRFDPVHALLCVRHVRPRLIDRCFPSEYVRLRALDISLRNRNATYQCRNPPPLVSDLSFESSLLGKRVLEGVLIRSVIDLKQQFALLYKLIVVDVQANDRPVHLRRDSNEIGHHFRVIRSWLAIDFEKHNQTKNDRSQYDGYTKNMNRVLAGVLPRFQFHSASSVKKKEPKSECEYGCQAGIHHDWRRERFFEMQLQ